MSIIDGKELTKMPDRQDPIHEEKGQWLFYDETWSDRWGPFATREDAAKGLDLYCQRYLGLKEGEHQPTDKEFSEGMNALLCGPRKMLNCSIHGPAQHIETKTDGWRCTRCIQLGEKMP